MIQMTNLLATFRNVNSAQRERLDEGIVELRSVLQFITSSIEQRSVPTTERLVTIYPIIERGNDALSETLTAFQRQTEPVQPTMFGSPIPSASSRQEGRPATPPPRKPIRPPPSETSNFNDDDRMIELIRMLVEDQSDDDDASTVTGDERVNEISDTDHD
jgi:hypothetical protein